MWEACEREVAAKKQSRKFHVALSLFPGTLSHIFFSGICAELEEQDVKGVPQNSILSSECIFFLSWVQMYLGRDGQQPGEQATISTGTGFCVSSACPLLPPAPAQLNGVEEQLRLLHQPDKQDCASPA